jgi:hypothetical protein
MSRAPRDIWEDRPVIFAEITLEQGDDVIVAFAEQNRLKACRHLVALCMRYADTNELVFKSPAEAHALGMRMAAKMGRFYNKALFANGMRDEDPELEPASPPASNGHDAETTSPSH